MRVSAVTVVSFVQDNLATADDDDQDLEQRENMSRQMTDILKERVRQLGTVLSAAKQTLDLDVDAATDDCTARLQSQRLRAKGARYGADDDDQQLNDLTAAATSGQPHFGGLHSRTTTTFGGIAQSSHFGAGGDRDVSTGQVGGQPGGVPSRLFTAKGLFGGDRGPHAKANSSGSGGSGGGGTGGAGSGDARDDGTGSGVGPAAARYKLGGLRLGHGHGGGSSRHSIREPKSNDRSRSSMAHKETTILASTLFSSTNNRERMVQERELHRLADRHVTRSVEAIWIQYGPESAPFDARKRLLMDYSLSHISLPPHENINQSFARMLHYPVVEDIYECLFWYNIGQFFCRSRIAQSIRANARDSVKVATLREDERRLEQDLGCFRQDLSKLYIRLIRKFQTVPALKRDLIHRYIPFAVAHAILVGLRYLCPGSRHLYTLSLQKQVYCVCCELLLGTAVSEVSIQSIREKLFPYELRSAFVRDDQSAQQLEGDHAGEGAADGAARGAGAGAAGDEPTSPGDGGVDDLSLQLRTFQPRQRHDAMRVGSLLHEMLAKGEPGLDIRPGSAPAHMVYQTIPTADSRVGGTNTFRKRSSQPTIIKELSQRYARERDEYQAFAHKSRQQMRSRTRKVAAQQESLLRGGVAQVGRFCLDLAQGEPELLHEYALAHDDGAAGGAGAGGASASQEQQRRRRRRRARTIEGSISGESRGVRNKHLQGEQKLDFHANLAVHINLPPADRVIVTTERIEASRKSDRQKPRTKARMLLCTI